MTESHTDQVDAILRQRMMKRAATFTEGAQRPGNTRRRSSVLSDYSDTRQSFRSSTESLHRNSGHNDRQQLPNSDEASFWHSAPLAFAVVPAFAGLLFQNGSAVVTDILLLGFGSMFLNWCVRAPWEWYHAAQQVQYIDSDEADDDHDDDTILEEDEDSKDAEDHGSAPQSPTDEASSSAQKAQRVYIKPIRSAQEDARKELQVHEMLALGTCFVGPLLGAYLLHALRSQLTRPAEGLVSNFNLTIFVMAAELRPFSHIIKMKQARMLHLQRIVRSDSQDMLRKTDVQEIFHRVAELEARAPVSHDTDVETVKLGASIRQSLQPQLDALNRAVRRYEKRQAAQSMQSEARFQELDNRLRDALSLAAAAARTGQQPGIFSIALTWMVNFVTFGLQTAWTITTYPFRTIATTASHMQGWVMKTGQQTRKRVKGQGIGPANVPVAKRSGR